MTRNYKKPLRPITPAKIPEPFFDRCALIWAAIKIPFLVLAAVIVVLVGSFFEIIKGSANGRH